MRKLLLVSALSLCCISANAAGVYVLTDVAAYNQFTGFAPSSISGGSLPLAGTATVDGAGNVSIAGLQFSAAGAGGTYTYTNGNWSTTVGGSSIVNSGICTDISGAACSNPFYGFAPLGASGIFDTGFDNVGTPDTSFCPPVGITPPNNGGAGDVCNQISVVENAGSSLIITEQSEFTFVVPDTPLGYIYTFTVVPVPAAVWLFGSALGLLGWIRRRAA